MTFDILFLCKYNAQVQQCMIMIQWIVWHSEYYHNLITTTLESCLVLLDFRHSKNFVIYGSTLVISCLSIVPILTMAQIVPCDSYMKKRFCSYKFSGPNNKQCFLSKSVLSNLFAVSDSTFFYPKESFIPTFHFYKQWFQCKTRLISIVSKPIELRLWLLFLFKNVISKNVWSKKSTSKFFFL